MQSPLTVPRGHTQTPPASKSPAEVAREIISHLNSWAAQCPLYRQSLVDCAEDIAWGARLPPSPAPEASGISPLKHGAKQILTLLSLWAQTYPVFSRHLLACFEEVEQLAARHEKKDDSVRARDQVFLSFETAELLTSKEIADLTGLKLRRVNRALVRLRQLGLVRDAGCAAQCHSDGFRLRRYKLTH